MTTVRLFPVLPALVAAACSLTDHRADFASNERFYVDVPFRTRAPGDRDLYVAPVRDGRAGRALPTQERGFPIAYFGDEFWDRPVPEMVAEVLERQLDASGLFPSVGQRAAPEVLVLKPTLVAFDTGSLTAMSGVRSFAEVALRIEVLGPAGIDGKRPVWHDNVYTDRQVTDLALKPISPYLLAGQALRTTMQRLLVGLDGSNISRSHVPVELLLGDGPQPVVEASAPQR